MHRTPLESSSRSLRAGGPQGQPVSGLAGEGPSWVSTLSAAAPSFMLPRLWLRSPLQPQRGAFGLAVLEMELILPRWDAGQRNAPPPERLLHSLTGHLQPRPPSFPAVPLVTFLPIHDASSMSSLLSHTPTGACRRNEALLENLSLQLPKCSHRGHSSIPEPRAEHSNCAF